VGITPVPSRADAMSNRTGPLDGLISDDRERGVFRVNRRVFVDEEIFALERERIFDKVWLYIGHSSEIPRPGDFVRRQVAGRPLILVRDRQGTVRVLVNSCTHRGALVCKEAAGNTKFFQCTYHGWVYDTAGALVDIPSREAMSPDCNADGALNLRAVPRCEEFRGFIFVCFSKDTGGLEDYLAGAKEYLSYIADMGELGMEVVKGAEEYCIPSNWKLMQENSVDAYHATTTHQSYNEYLVARDGAKPFFDPNLNFGRVRHLGNGHAVSESIDGVPWGRPYARWIPGWGEEARLEIEAIERRIIERVGPERARVICRGDRNMVIFPNLAVHDIMGITIRNLLPQSAGAHDINSWALAPIGESEASRQRRLRNYVEFLGPAGMATPDDTEMLELCQRGYANNVADQWNDVSRGMRKPRDQIKKSDELQMRSFWRRWYQLMSSADIEVDGP
jgi:p-cumate 2,3-dioxygenase subunit alpha